MKHFLILILLASCNPVEEFSDINCEYQNAIVYKKHPSYINGNTMYDLKYNGEVLRYVKVYDIDSSYKVGDTINGLCRGLFMHIKK
jgi:hypothetical protein